MKTKIYFLLAIFLVIFYSCEQTRNTCYNIPNNIVGMSTDLRELKITESGTNKISFRDTIVGELMFVNKVKGNLYANIKNTSSMSNYKYEKGLLIKIAEDADTYVVWFDKKLTIHYRPFDFNETISSTKINK